MTVQELRGNNWIVYEVISGSKAYGTDLATSDTDIRGVFILPTKEVLKGNYIAQVADKTNDTVFYEIGRFIELLSKGNPNILELLNVSPDCILFESPEFSRYFPDKNLYLTKRLRNSFAGYAIAQLKKARGMNKKIHNPQPVERKSILDFCYVIDGAKSIGFWEWVFKLIGLPSEYIDKEWLMTNVISKWGLVKVQNGKGLYALYRGEYVVEVDEPGYFERVIFTGFRGIVKSLEATDFRLSSVPKNVSENESSTLMYFNQDGFKKHCKDFKQYHEWVENRNPERYIDNQKGNIGYDHKNMMHCIRLLEVARDIVQENEIVVRRPNAQHLIDIRMGKYTYEDLLEYAESLIANIDILFQISGLPDEVDREKTSNTLLKIRLENL